MAVTREETGVIYSWRFLDWRYYFLGYIEPLTAECHKVLLIYTRYRSNLSIAVVDLFHEKNIIVYVLPTHTYVKPQPLDVVFFSI